MPARHGDPGGPQRRRWQAPRLFFDPKAPFDGVFPFYISLRNIVKNATNFFFHFKRRKCLTGVSERKKPADFQKFYVYFHNRMGGFMVEITELFDRGRFSLTDGFQNFIIKTKPGGRKAPFAQERGDAHESIDHQSGCDVHQGGRF
ncbi:MAG: hypothetical protein VB023_05420 [Oscillibacter sp.]|nr:hypothetical protein [Oscillibacter sp.]